VDSDSSPLDATDIVMVDASRPAPGSRSPVSPNQFLARTKIQWFSELSARITRFNRWRSPKACSESYGTFRSAGLAGELQQRHGIELNGIVLVSTVLDFATIRPAENNDRPNITFLPTYTATAWYHKKLAPELQADLKKTLDEARAFALGEYATALLKGNRLTEAERKAVAQKVARYTGLPAEFVEQANLRIDSGRFRKELLRDKRLATGRLDSRFTAMDADAAGAPGFDPSTAIQGLHTALFVDYVRRELNYKTDMMRRAVSRGTTALHEPLASHEHCAPPWRAPFQVLVVWVHDMATPFFGAERRHAWAGSRPTHSAWASPTTKPAHDVIGRPLRQLKRTSRLHQGR
jgi:hypothetical protein